jgi:hypothetical protein
MIRKHICTKRHENNVLVFCQAYLLTADNGDATPTTPLLKSISICVICQLPLLVAMLVVEEGGKGLQDFETDK